jgi:hypothetical protein
MTAAVLVVPPVSSAPLAIEAPCKRPRLPAIGFLNLEAPESYPMKYQRLVDFECAGSNQYTSGWQRELMSILNDTITKMVVIRGTSVG